MVNPDDAEIGATVYLRPQTRTAPAECHRRLAAVLVSVTEWPYTIVRVFDRDDDGRGREIKVHRDNIGLRRRTAKKEKDGDQVGGPSNRATGMVGKPIGRPASLIDPASGYEDGVLF